ncbi:MAG: hypothetical protein ACRETO_09205 [Gammaproteobacteria bacterium]
MAGVMFFCTFPDPSTLQGITNMARKKTSRGRIRTTTKAAPKRKAVRRVAKTAKKAARKTIKKRKAVARVTRAGKKTRSKATSKRRTAKKAAAKSRSTKRPGKTAKKRTVRKVAKPAAPAQVTKELREQWVDEQGTGMMEESIETSSGFEHFNM